MSTINVRQSRGAAGSVNYALYGNSPRRRDALLERGETRAASYALSITGAVTTPAAFVERAEHLAETYGRKITLHTYVLAFHPDEFDVTSQQDLDRIRDVAINVTERMHSADYMVVVHADSIGGHGHAHILVINHDNLTGKALQRYTSWRHGLHQLNDEVMREEGLRVLPDPQEPKPDWEQRREAFEPSGFEQILGDKIREALRDPRSVDRSSFEAVLAEHDVTLAVTDRDGWSYKMRRIDNGKYGRKKASRLTPEFTAEGAQQIFDYHAQRRRHHGAAGHDQRAGRATPDFGVIGAIDLEAPRRRTAAHSPDREGSRGDRRARSSGRGTGQTSRTDVDLVAARAALDLAARHRDEQQAERDREDARKHREAVERERSREATRRIISDQVGRGRVFDDEPAQQGDTSDDFSLE